MWSRSKKAVSTLMQDPGWVVGWAEDGNNQATGVQCQETGTESEPGQDQYQASRRGTRTAGREQGQKPESATKGQEQAGSGYGCTQAQVTDSRSWCPLCNDSEYCRALNRPLGAPPSNMHACAHEHTQYTNVHAHAHSFEHVLHDLFIRTHLPVCAVICYNTSRSVDPGQCFMDGTHWSAEQITEESPVLVNTGISTDSSDVPV